MQANAYTALYDLLVASGASFFDDLADSVVKTSGKALWLTEAPDKEIAYPQAIIAGISDRLTKYFNTTADDVDMTFQIDLFVDAEDSNILALLTLNDKLIAVLDEAAITVTNHKGAQIQMVERGVPFRELDSYRITSEWRLIATAA